VLKHCGLACWVQGILKFKIHHKNQTTTPFSTHPQVGCGKAQRAHQIIAAIMLGTTVIAANAAIHMKKSKSPSFPLFQSGKPKTTPCRKIQTTRAFIPLFDKDQR